MKYLFAIMVLFLYSYQAKGVTKDSNNRAETDTLARKPMWLDERDIGHLWRDLPKEVKISYVAGYEQAELDIRKQIFEEIGDTFHEYQKSMSFGILTGLLVAETCTHYPYVITGLRLAPKSSFIPKFCRDIDSFYQYHKNQSVPFAEAYRTVSTHMEKEREALIEEMRKKLGIRSRVYEESDKKEIRKELEKWLDE